MLIADLERWIQAYENKCYRSTLGISYKEHKTNEYVWQQVSILTERQEQLLSTVKRRKLSWLGHICHHYTLLKVSLHDLRSLPQRRLPSAVPCSMTTWRNGQVSHRCRYCASQMTEVNWPSQRRRVCRACQRRLAITRVSLLSKEAGLNEARWAETKMNSLYHWKELRHRPHVSMGS